MCSYVGSRISEVRERRRRGIRGGGAGVCRVDGYNRREGLCVCVCVCVCWVGEDQDRKTARAKKRKGKRDRDSDKGRQREREESQRLNRKQQTACVCRDCVWVGEGGQEPLHLRAPGEGIRWLAHLEAAIPESWLFCVCLT